MWILHILLLLYAVCSEEAKDILLKDYRVDSPPSLETDVRFRLQMRWLSKVNPSESTFSANFRLEFQWNDPRLTWKLGKFQQPSIRLGFGEVWAPLFAIHSLEGTIPVAPEQVLVTKDGLVRTNFDFSFGGFCLVEPEFFPYDSHYCLMDFAQTSNGVRLVHDQSNYPLVNPNSPVSQHMVDK